MRYYVFYVEGYQAFEYLNGTNLVGVWDNSLELAHNKCKSYFSDGTYIRLASDKEKDRYSIGYLY